MKSRMQKLISISTIPVLALALLLVSGTALADDAALGVPKPAPALAGTTEHEFVGHLEIVDDKGRLLAWEGTISGDINGVIQWWMGPMSTIGHVSSYVYRVEIWNSDKTVLLLAGEQAGSTTAAPGKDLVWRGKGIVTEASAEFEEWIGRQVYESGHATWAIPGVLPDYGVSTFLIPLVVDFNGDGKVDNADISIMAGYWNTGDPVCDIGPTPLGDGIVDAQDLLVLTEYLTKPDVEADIAAIEEVLNQYAVAVNTGDFELWLSLHADDVVKMGPDAPAIFGREALRASKEAAWDNFTLEMALYPEEAQVSGDLGFARGTYTLSITPKAGGETIIAVPDGKYLTLCKRQADGTWEISQDCYNSNVPPQ
jgi:uncharacterized protein (TIGR02246 family)